MNESDMYILATVVKELLKERAMNEFIAILKEVSDE